MLHSIIGCQVCWKPRGTGIPFRAGKRHILGVALEHVYLSCSERLVKVLLRRGNSELVPRLRWHECVPLCLWAEDERASNSSAHARLVEACSRSGNRRPGTLLSFHRQQSSIVLLALNLPAPPWPLLTLYLSPSSFPLPAANNVKSTIASVKRVGRSKGRKVCARSQAHTFITRQRRLSCVLDARPSTHPFASISPQSVRLPRSDPSCRLAPGSRPAPVRRH